MTRNSEFKEIHIKNCTYYYFDDMIDIYDFNTKNINVDTNNIKILLFTTLDVKH